MTAQVDLDFRREPPQVETAIGSFAQERGL
jgi:hypothetical protein